MFHYARNYQLASLGLITLTPKYRSGVPIITFNARRLLYVYRNWDEELYNNHFLNFFFTHSAISPYLSDTNKRLPSVPMIVQLSKIAT